LSVTVDSSCYFLEFFFFFSSKDRKIDSRIDSIPSSPKSRVRSPSAFFTLDYHLTNQQNSIISIN